MNTLETVNLVNVLYYINILRCQLFFLGDPDLYYQLVLYLTLYLSTSYVKPDNVDFCPENQYCIFQFFEDHVCDHLNP
jgi:hypothetical protein